MVCTPNVRTYVVVELSNRQPLAGSGVVRIDPLRFLAGCRTRRLNAGLVLFYILACFNCIVAYYGPFCILLIFVGMVVLVKLSLLAK